MTEMKSASEILDSLIWFPAKAPNSTQRLLITKAMHTHTEQALREFAERVRKNNQIWYKENCANHQEILIILDQLLTEIRKGE